jgi:hypothetical protein
MSNTRASHTLVANVLARSARIKFTVKIAGNHRSGREENINLMPLMLVMLSLVRRRKIPQRPDSFFTRQATIRETSYLKAQNLVLA